MEFIQIGRITTTHGLEGKLILNHHLGKNNKLKELKHFFVELKRESYIPYFIDSITFSNDEEAYVMIEDINSLEAGKTLSGKNVYLSTDQYEKLKPKDNNINFEGFEVSDASFGIIGKIESLIETPGQLLATILHNEIEVIIPLNDQTIKDINITTKKLKVTLPDGLLDVYLDN